MPAGQRRRVVIVGGGWGGLAAARHVREQAPELEVVLLERNAVFRSLPLSNKWLGSLIDERLLVHDYRAAAQAYGYVFIQDEVVAIDRDARRVFAARGAIAYDWLVLATGIRHNYAAWFGDDLRAAAHVRQHYGSAYTAGDELVALKRKLDVFAGGDLLMTLPPAPYRCPPAPYERALMIGWLLKTRRIPGRLIVLDPNRASAGFTRRYADEYRDQITYVADVQVRSVDPFARRVVTDFDDYRFDDALLMPPQQAADLVWQAGLIGHDGEGRAQGWGEQHPVRLQARADERIYLIGDNAGPVSPLFGAYPKTGHLASRMGGIVARHIAASASGRKAADELPESSCHVMTRVEPMEMLRIDSSYRFRGDGVIMQSSRQTEERQPRGEDLQWVQGMFRELLGGPQ